MNICIENFLAPSAIETLLFLFNWFSALRPTGAYVTVVAAAILILFSDKIIMFRLQFLFHTPELSTGMGYCGGCCCETGRQSMAFVIDGIYWLSN